MNESTAAIVCSSCGGDPRASLSCAACGGAGVGVPSSLGFLTWTYHIDDFTMAFRKIRRAIITAFHLALFCIGALCLSVFVLSVLRLEDVSEVFSLSFWVSGSWPVILLWLGFLIDCFLIFRLAVYLREEKELPEQAPSTPATANYRFDVQPYFSEAALTITEDAYRVTRDLRVIEIKPLMLFAATLTSRSGAVFLMRLGLSFDKIKEPLARLMNASSQGQPPIVFSRDAKRVLALAFADALERHRPHVGPMEIFLQAFDASPEVQDVLDHLGFPPEHVKQVAEWIRLQEELRDDYRSFVKLAHLKPNTGMNRAMTARQTPLLNQLSQDLTLMARNGYIAAAVEREQELESLLQGIESGRRSVALVGETGVGKTALIGELARRMVIEDVPQELFDRRLVSVNIAQVLAAGDPALASERLLSLFDEVRISGNIILVMEGIEALVGGARSGPMDLAEMLAAALDQSSFIVIATTTPGAWTEYLERRSLGSKLVKVLVSPLSSDKTLHVLMARSGMIEYEQNVILTFAALDKATSLATRYLTDIAPPESALGVLREAAVRARKVKGEDALVTAEDVAGVIHEKTGIPVQAVTQDEAQKLLDLETHLHGRVIGQEEAVMAVAQAMRRARAELREGRRPIVNLLFMGPTGVGKTELSKALAAEYFGSEQSMIRLDMSEYQEPSSVQRIIGASGDERGGLLTEAVRHRPFSIVLLDEIEKAHPDILNLFLQVMDDGRLTDGVGRTVDFTNTVLIMTSNAGTAFIQAEVTNGTPLAQIRNALMERELKGIFRPEFLNRFDGVIVFKPLTLDDVTQIAWLLIHGVTARLEEKGMHFRAEDVAVEGLARAGFDPLFGARPLRRVLQEKVETALADLLLRHEVDRGDTIVFEGDGHLRVEKRALL